MQAFVNCKEYIDYLDVIKNSDIKIAKKYEENEKGLEYLYNIQDELEQKKIIKVFKLIDSELSYNGSKDNEMFKKINYLLSTGVLFTNYNEYIKDLNPNELFALIYGEYSKVDKYNEPLLPLFTNKELLDTIINKYNEDLENNNVKVFGISDFFFMIKEYYLKNKFDINDEEKRKEFLDEMINRVKTDTLHDGVNNMLEYWNSEEVDEMKRRIS